MASSMIVKLVSMVVMCMVLGAPVAQAITCGQVSTSLTPCINYVKGGEVVPPPACCRGITSLNGKANTTADRQAACKCVKQLAGAISGINPNLAAGLPGKCGVNVPYEISPNTNCSTLK